jgi:hypothetical protein
VSKVWVSNRRADDDYKVMLGGPRGCVTDVVAFVMAAKERRWKNPTLSLMSTQGPRYRSRVIHAIALGSPRKRRPGLVKDIANFIDNFIGWSWCASRVHRLLIIAIQRVP